MFTNGAFSAEVEITSKSYAAIKVYKMFLFIYLRTSSDKITVFKNRARDENLTVI